MSKKIMFALLALASFSYAAGDFVDEGSDLDVAVVDIKVNGEDQPLPGLSVHTGPVDVQASEGCSVGNIEALAHATVLALHQTLSEVVTTVSTAVEESEVAQNATEFSDSLENASEELAEAVDAIETAEEETVEAASAISTAISEVGDAIASIGNAMLESGQAAIAALEVSGHAESFLNFLIEKYGLFVEFFSNGWKHMVYSSVEGATRHIVFSAVTKSSHVDLSAFNEIDRSANACLEKMDAVCAELLAAAGERSPELKQAVGLYLDQYRSWFVGESEALVNNNSTDAMLKCLGVRSIGAAEFSLKNLERFSALGGVTRHQNLWFSIKPLDCGDDECFRSADDCTAESKSIVEAAAAEADEITREIDEVTRDMAEESVARDILEAIVADAELA